MPSKPSNSGRAGSGGFDQQRRMNAITVFQTQSLRSKIPTKEALLAGKADLAPAGVAGSDPRGLDDVGSVQ